MSSTVNSHAARGSRNNPADTVRQRFMEEQCYKEAAMRLKRHAAKQASSSDEDVMITPGCSRQSEVYRKRLLAGCPKPADWLLEVKANYQPPQKFNRRRQTFECQPALSTSAGGDLIDDQSSAHLLDMIPPDEITKRKLYVGISRENKGRAEYLRERAKVDPECKYYVPILNSLEHGWGLTHVMNVKDVKKPEHARSKLVQESFYRRTGIPTLPLPPAQ